MSDRQPIVSRKGVPSRDKVSVDVDTEQSGSDQRVSTQDKRTRRAAVADFRRWFQSQEQEEG